MVNKSHYDVYAIRKDFPILTEVVHGHPLVYLDNAATTQKPKAVIDAISEYYCHYNANVHRGLHALSETATKAYENARKSVKEFIGAKSEKECIFTRGTTESINLVASSFAEDILKPGDEVLITYLEHHSNIVPWQIACEKTGATLKVAPIDIHGDVIVEKFEELLSPSTRIVALNHVSNAIGTINPIHKLTQLAKLVDAYVLIDGAQAAPHVKIAVDEIGCDFYAFSGHKMYGPTGIGVLWGREEILESMRPYQSGGEMISYVRFEKSEYAPLPQKFEAGTPNIAAAIALSKAIDYLNALGHEHIVEYEQTLLRYATEALSSIDGIRIIGHAKEKASVVSFVFDDIHAHDVGTVIDTMGIALRSGHHCAMPLMEFFDVPATNRVSLALYNTREEIDVLVQSLNKVNEVFS